LKPFTWKLFPPQHETIDKGHGRIETRRIWCSSELIDYLDFPYQKQVIRIERVTTKLDGSHMRREVVCGITSLDVSKATPERLLTLNRGHWCIENRLHWVRDVTFDEDRSQIRTKSAPRAMATLRNIAISLLRLRNNINIAEALRLYAAKPHLTLDVIGA